MRTLSAPPPPRRLSAVQRFLIGLPVVAVLLVVVGLVVSTSGTTTERPQPSGSAPAAVEAPLPVALTVPDLGIVDAPLVDLGIDETTNEVEVPSDKTPEVVGWYAPGVRPGAVGPAVILGHVNGRPDGSAHSVPGIFTKLHTLQPGARIDVRRADGSVASFEVERLQTIAKSAFPTGDVYGDTAGPELRLITCGGEFDHGARSYKDQVIAYARQVAQ